MSDLEAVRQNGLALQYVKNMTKTIYNNCMSFSIKI